VESCLKKTTNLDSKTKNNSKEKSKVIQSKEIINKKERGRRRIGNNDF
jgi:hypothetical protein